MKKICAILLALVLILTLAACGGKEADQNSLVIWHDKEDAVAKVLEDYLKTALPDYVITLEKKTSLTDSLKLVGNDPSSAPDLFLFAHDKVGLFAEMGILAPVEDLLPADALDAYLPMTVEAATYKGTVYQLPLYFETLLFLYNSKYMTPEMAPETTEDLYAYMEANTGRDRFGFVEQHSTAYYAAAWIHGFGGEILSADGTPFPDPQAVKDALRYHQKFVALMPGRNRVRHGETPSSWKARPTPPSAVPGWCPAPGMRALNWASRPCPRWTKRLFPWRPIPASRASTCSPMQPRTSLRP